MNDNKDNEQFPTRFKLVSYYLEEWKNSKKSLLQLKTDLISGNISLEIKFQKLSEIIRLFQNLHRANYYNKKSLERYNKRNCISLKQAIKSYFKIEEIIFYTKILPFMIEQALLLEERAKIKYGEQTMPLMVKGKAMKESIPKLLFLSIISNNFFCNHKDFIDQLTPKQIELIKVEEWNKVDWFRLYNDDPYDSVCTERIICFLAYFDIAYKIISQSKNDYFEKDIIVERILFNFDEIKKNLSQCENIFEENDINIHIKDMNNPEIKTQSLVNFANRNFQTGQILSSATQEEVLFCLRPELYVAMFICQRVNINEIVIISNAYKLMENEGYLYSFKFSNINENYLAKDLTIPYDKENENILCLDATFRAHYSLESVAQDISKFYSACNYCNKKYNNAGISTGSWGCGVFGCDKAHKFLQQLICAKANNVKLSFSTFGNQKYAEDLKRLIKSIIKNTPKVCDLYKLIIDFRGKNDEDFHLYLKKFLGDRFDINKD